jgi:hypothetical protein
MGGVTKEVETKLVKTFIHEVGFIEQHYLGDQTGKSVTVGVQAVDEYVRQGTTLVLVDLTEVTSTNRASHIAAIKGMKEVRYKRIAAYGPKHLQVLINTLAAIARKGLDVRAFSCRYDALEWLWLVEASHTDEKLEA